MEMMYDTVYKALKEAGLDHEYEPQDYLNFFCLGNREAPDEEESSSAKTPPVCVKLSLSFALGFQVCNFY